MDRLRRLAGLWSWLPAFRVVAETEHLPTAARLLGVSPSALSRAIGLLEDALGRPLFLRRGRRILLAPPGARLLSSLRLAMRGLDSALDAARGQLDSGVVRLAAPAAFVPLYLLPAVARLRRAYPGLQPVVTVTSAAEARRGLLDGTLDLGLFDDPEGHPELLLERLRALRFGVYCGPGHPLYRRRRAGPAALATHPFVVCAGADRWPRHLPRRVGLEVSDVTLAREACARGDFLTVLADVVAEAHPLHLRRLPVDVVPRTALCTIRRRPHEIATAADLVLRALRGQDTSAGARVARSPLV